MDELVEGNQAVVGSIPTHGSNLNRRPLVIVLAGSMAMPKLRSELYGYHLADELEVVLNF